MEKQYVNTPHGIRLVRQNKGSLPYILIKGQKTYLQTGGANAIVGYSLVHEMGANRQYYDFNDKDSAIEHFMTLFNVNRRLEWFEQHPNEKYIVLKMNRNGFMSFFVNNIYELNIHRVLGLSQPRSLEDIRQQFQKHGDIVIKNEEGRIIEVYGIVAKIQLSHNCYIMVRRREMHIFCINGNEEVDLGVVSIDVFLNGNDIIYRDGEFHIQPERTRRVIVEEYGIDARIPNIRLWVRQ